MNQRPAVLLVEDDNVVLHDLHTLLTAEGYSVSGFATNVAEAIDILQAGGTDMAIVDIRLRDGDSGIAVGELLRERYGRPFIYLSGASDPATLRAAAASRPTAFLVKPVSGTDLLRALSVAAQATLPGSKPQPPGTAEGVLLDGCVFVKDGTVYRRVSVEEIRYVMAFRNYLELHLANRRLVVRHTLSDFFGSMPAGQFIRPHRSYLVNRQHITGFTDGSVLLDTIRIPLSRDLGENLGEGPLWAG
ncbi:LytR/AlgR family response regulator transcription factor [Lewinella sp. IMCC34183]|uniref:LytR/AlgR family response regulator transcription factor n=1 Tax=Lewinella sp. IMCC34183 TaxID=2248762 RepID=UPI0018E591C9|nr:response regulator transcription factor [Lewinella sp. IMCC34183]